ncbi:MAG: putative ABC transporter permease [Myxococcaceae bacterium]|nr:putative ABC transporter permease [Myxococcaceae bacterium]
MLRRFLLYGFAGWIVEVLFTGTLSAVRRDRAGTARTYLWMHPIYGATALAMEWLSKRLRPLPWPVRGLAYTAVIYGAEYSSGWALKKILGRCPWDYSGSGKNVHGLVRLDYAPAWYALGLLFEPLRDSLDGISASKPVEWPRVPGRR